MAYWIPFSTCDQPFHLVTRSEWDKQSSSSEDSRSKWATWICCRYKVDLWLQVITISSHFTTVIVTLMKMCPGLIIMNRRTKTAQTLVTVSNLFTLTVSVRLKKPKWNKKLKYMYTQPHERKTRFLCHSSDKTTKKILLHKILRHKGCNNYYPK